METNFLKPLCRWLDHAAQKTVVSAFFHNRIRETVRDLSDFTGYRQEFLQLFGFEVDGVDYDADVDPAVAIAQLVS